jgi:hypothetical protein
MTLEFVGGFTHRRNLFRLHFSSKKKNRRWRQRPATAWQELPPEK